MAAFYVPLPAYRPGGQIDFSPLNEGLDALGRTVEKNRLLSEARQIGEAMRSGAATDASGTTVTNPQVNRLLERIYPSEGAPSPAQASAAAAGRGFPATSPGNSSLPAANGNMSQYAGSIANIESGGDYGVRGPVTRSGDRAYGKYQVMGANVGPWTQQILGRAMTTDEFLADPQAQEKVFEAKFGEYVNRTGSPQDAASMWFTGRPAAEGANRRARDVNGRPLGITGQEYVNRFNSGIGQSGQPTAQPASAQPRPASINYAAGIDAALKLGNIQLAQQLIEQQRLSENAPLQTERMTQDVQKGRAELERAAEVRLGTLANTIQSAPPETQAAMWSRILQTHPEMAAQLQAYGVDPRDVKAGTDFFVQQARGLTPSQLTEVSPGATLYDKGRGQAIYTAPRPPQQLSAAERKEVFDSDAAAQAGEGAIITLRKALELNDKAYSGFGAGTMGYVTRQFGGEAGQATAELDNLITAQALEQLKATFGAAPTEGERKILLDIQGSIGETAEVRRRIWENAIRMAERRIAFNKAQGGAIRSGDYFKPGFSPVTPGAAASTDRPQAGPQPGAVEDGYRFKGGDPAKPENWEKVQ